MRLLWQLFISFFRVGLFTFGGGFAMLPLIQNEVVDRHHWIGKQDFLDMMIVAQSAPGPIALNSAVFVGYKMARLWGALVALVGIVVPSFTIILMIALVFSDVRHNPVVDSAFKGMRPAVVALIIIPVVDLARKLHWSMSVVIVAVAFAIWKLEWSPVWMIGVAAVAGIAWEDFQARRNLNAKNGEK